MERQTWLADRRAAVEHDYDAGAPTYHDAYDPVTPTHRRFVTQLIASVPPGGAILDAPCGTGPYFELVEEAGRMVVGADQSRGMLAEARSRSPSVHLEHVGLQELDFEAEFDAAMCIDAMEHVPPEDWPRVLANLRRAVRPGGRVYLTVEEIDEADIEAGLADATARGLPVVHGEHVGDDTGGYHHYPGRKRVAGWLTDAGFVVLEEESERLDGYGYHHLLLTTEPGRSARRSSDAFGGAGD